MFFIFAEDNHGTAIVRPHINTNTFKPNYYKSKKTTLWLTKLNKLKALAKFTLRN